MHQKQKGSGVRAFGFGSSKSNRWHSGEGLNPTGTQSCRTHVIDNRDAAAEPELLGDRSQVRTAQVKDGIQVKDKEPVERGHTILHHGQALLLVQECQHMHTISTLDKEHRSSPYLENENGS